jgi:CDP-diacylglycerol--glycerol-3-phosphate 3-phosphatidyltransferase
MPPEHEAALPPWKARLPNTLTLLRLVLAAALFTLLALALDPPDPAAGFTSQSGTLLLALALFVAAAATDALDGHLARKWHAVSLFGRVMDPFADKILILGSFILMAGPAFTIHAQSPLGARSVSLTGLAPWMVVLILGRELLVTTLRGVYESAGVDFSATATGKLKMILQSVAIPAIFLILALTPATPGSGARIAVLALAWATVAVTVWSGVPYVLRARRAGRAMGKSA